MSAVRVSIVIWLIVAAAVAVGLYHVKYDVQHMEERLSQVRGRIQEHRSALHVLEAEWNRLNRPDRLKRLAETHLDMGPTLSRQVVSVARIPPRITREVKRAERRDDAPSLDGIPVPQAKPWSLSPDRPGDRPGGPTGTGPRSAGRTQTAAADPTPASADPAPASADARSGAGDRAADGGDAPDSGDGRRTISVGDIRIDIGGER